VDTIPNSEKLSMVSPEHMVSPELESMVSPELEQLSMVSGTLRTFFAAILDRIGRLWTVPGTGSASSQA